MTFDFQRLVKTKKNIGLLSPSDPFPGDSMLPMHVSLRLKKLFGRDHPFAENYTIVAEFRSVQYNLSGYRQACLIILKLIFPLMLLHVEVITFSWLLDLRTIGELDIWEVNQIGTEMARVRCLPQNTKKASTKWES